MPTGEQELAGGEPVLDRGPARGRVAVEGSAPAGAREQGAWGLRRIVLLTYAHLNTEDSRALRQIPDGSVCSLAFVLGAAFRQMRANDIRHDLVTGGVVVESIALEKILAWLAIGAEERVPQLNEIEVLSCLDIGLEQRIRLLSLCRLCPSVRGWG